MEIFIYVLIVMSKITVIYGIVVIAYRIKWGLRLRKLRMKYFQQLVEAGFEYSITEVVFDAICCTVDGTKKEIEVLGKLVG